VFDAMVSGCRSGPKPRSVTGLRPIRAHSKRYRVGGLLVLEGQVLNICSRGKSTAAMGCDAGEKASGRAHEVGTLLGDGGICKQRGSSWADQGRLGRLLLEVLGWEIWKMCVW
jgi:hypothetical protein